MQGRQRLCWPSTLPCTHPQAGLVECWEAPGMRPSSQGVSGGTEAVKSCLSPFLQTISDISLDNTTLSQCRPQHPPPGPPTAVSAVYSWALTIGILTWRNGRPALPSDPPSPWQLEPGRPGLCVRITDPEFTILLPCKQKHQQQHLGSSARLEGTEEEDPQGTS